MGKVNKRKRVKERENADNRKIMQRVDTWSIEFGWWKTRQ
jgi:hypothetical protein